MKNKSKFPRNYAYNKFKKLYANKVVTKQIVEDYIDKMRDLNYYYDRNHGKYHILRKKLMKFTLQERTEEIKKNVIDESIVIMKLDALRAVILNQFVTCLKKINKILNN